MLPYLSNYNKTANLFIGPKPDQTSTISRRSGARARVPKHKPRCQAARITHALCAAGSAHKPSLGRPLFSRCFEVDIETSLHARTGTAGAEHAIINYSIWYFRLSSSTCPFRRCADKAQRTDPPFPSLSPPFDPGYRERSRAVNLRWIINRHFRWLCDSICCS